MSHLFSYRYWLILKETDATILSSVVFKYLWEMEVADKESHKEGEVRHKNAGTTSTLIRPASDVVNEKWVSSFSK